MPDQLIHDRLQEKSIILMDGATGTELQRRGFELQSPGWSATAIREAPEILLSIHHNYVGAGAEILTTNTFRTHSRNLKETIWANDARQLTIDAVEIARQASNGLAYLAGSIAPLEDCYSPELTPSESELEAEHALMIENLLAAGVDFLLCETQITIREASILAKLCQRSRAPFMISFTCGRDGKLLSGESLAEAVKSVMYFGPEAILVNCIPIDEVLPALQKIHKTAPEMVLGAQANTGRLGSDGTWESTEGEYPAVYAEFAMTWKEFGARLIGGCCGTGSRHIKFLSETVCVD